MSGAENMGAALGRPAPAKLDELQYQLAGDAELMQGELLRVDEHLEIIRSIAADLSTPAAREACRAALEDLEDHLAMVSAGILACRDALDELDEFAAVGAAP